MSSFKNFLCVGVWLLSSLAIAADFPGLSGLSSKTSDLLGPELKIELPSSQEWTQLLSIFFQVKSRSSFRGASREDLLWSAEDIQYHVEQVSHFFQSFLEPHQHRSKVVIKEKDWTSLQKQGDTFLKSLYAFESLLLDYGEQRLPVFEFHSVGAYNQACSRFYRDHLPLWSIWNKFSQALFVFFHSKLSLLAAGEAGRHFILDSFRSDSAFQLLFYEPQEGPVSSMVLTPNYVTGHVFTSPVLLHFNALGEDQMHLVPSYLLSQGEGGVNQQLVRDSGWLIGVESDHVQWSVYRGIDSPWPFTKTPDLMVSLRDIVPEWKALLPRSLLTETGEWEMGKTAFVPVPREEDGLAWWVILEAAIREWAQFFSKPEQEERKQLEEELLGGLPINQFLDQLESGLVDQFVSQAEAAIQQEQAERSEQVKQGKVDQNPLRKPKSLGKKKVKKNRSRLSKQSESQGKREENLPVQATYDQEEVLRRARERYEQYRDITRVKYRDLLKTLRWFHRVVGVQTQVFEGARLRQRGSHLSLTFSEGQGLRWVRPGQSKNGEVPGWQVSNLLKILIDRYSLPSERSEQ